MQTSEIEICQRVGAIRTTVVSMKDDAWQISMDINRIGWDNVVDQAGKVKTFKSLDTVYDLLKNVGVNDFVVRTNSEENRFEVPGTGTLLMREYDDAD